MSAASAPPTQVDQHGAYQVVEPHLMAGERILWVGHPDPAKHFTPADRFLVPFSLLWGGFAIAWEVAAIADGGAGFSLFGIPFVLIGLYLIFGRFVFKARRKRRTFYAVTNRRVLGIVKRRSGDQVDAYFISTLPAVNTQLRKDGSGTVTFGGQSSLFGGMANTGWDFFGTSSGNQPFAFFDIADAAYVADLVMRERERS